MTNNDKARNSRVRNGIIAGAAGIALLLGGTTFALWTDSVAHDSAGMITSGKLDLNKKSAAAVYDVSGDRYNADTDVPGSEVQGQLISSLANHKIVPGDTIAVHYPFTATLEGSNMVAKLTAQLAEGYSDSFTNDTLAGTYKILSGVTEVSSGNISISSGKIDLGYFASDDSEEKAADGITIAEFPSGNADLDVVFFFTFGEDGTPVNVSKAKALTAATFTLEQVRDTAGLYVDPEA